MNEEQFLTLFKSHLQTFLRDNIEYITYCKYIITNNLIHWNCPFNRLRTHMIPLKIFNKTSNYYIQRKRKDKLCTKMIEIVNEL